MVLDTTAHAVLARSPLVARAPWTRARGMIGRSFEGFDALVIPRCGSVHTWFMSRPLDLLFLDGRGRVLRIEIEAQPWRVLWGPAGTRTVIELPPSTLRNAPVKLDDTIAWEEGTSAPPKPGL